MKFGIHASKGQGKTFMIREVFSFIRPAYEGGKDQPISGHVDEGVIKAHPKEYAEFKAELEAHKDDYFERARKASPDPIFLFPVEKEETVEVKEVEKKKK